MGALGGSSQRAGMAPAVAPCASPFRWPAQCFCCSCRGSGSKSGQAAPCVTPWAWLMGRAGGWGPSENLGWARPVPSARRGPARPFPKHHGDPGVTRTCAGSEPGPTSAGSAVSERMCGHQSTTSLSPARLRALFWGRWELRTHPHCRGGSQGTLPRGVDCSVARAHEGRGWHSAWWGSRCLPGDLRSP